MPAAEPSIYQLRIALRDIEPPVWRRFRVSGDTNLHKLHRIIQVVMGWHDYHLYRFLVNGVQYGEPDPEDAFYELDIKDARRKRLSRAAPFEGCELLYTYDWGDGWEHSIVVEKVLPVEPEVSYPTCLGGERACPPEDCGGSAGYLRLLDILADPEDEEHLDMKQWVGRWFAPERFDPVEVNRLLWLVFRSAPISLRDLPKP